jgi:predicted nuclease of predicted toxin-antitoxin system
VKVLLDTCVWGGVRSVLAEAGHHVEWVGEWDKDPGDEEIMAYAFRHGQVLVTLDKDFGELVFLYGQSHRGIIRLVGIKAHSQGTTCLEVLKRYEALLPRGALITAEPSRIRVRLPEETENEDG